MLKKMVLVGILVVTLLVLSGCGAYDANCTESSSQKCYGKLVVPKLDPAVKNNCNDVGFKTIGNLCFAVGDEARCDTLPSSGASGKLIQWTSLYIPKYETNFCVETCGIDFVTQCGSGASCGTTASKDGVGKGFSLCSPTCTSDAQCLPGLTSCQSGKCLPLSDLLTEPALGTPEMLVELVPKNIPANGPVQGQFYDVDIFITSKYGQSIAEQLSLVFKTKSGAPVTSSLATAKAATSGPFAGKTWSYFPDSNGDFYWLQFGSTPTLINPGQRYWLGTLAVKANVGAFGVDLNTASANTKIGYNKDKKYTLSAPASPSFCVPKTTAACSELGDLTTACGKLNMPDGCGGVLVCAGQKTCAESELCNAQNTCELVVKLSNADSSEQTLLQAMSAALEPKKIADGGQHCVSDSECSYGCAEQYELCDSSKISKLSKLVQALKAWWAAQQ